MSKLFVRREILPNIVRAASVAVALTAAPAQLAWAQPSLDQVLGDFGVAAADIQRVKNGELVEHALSATSERELAVSMFFLVQAPPAELKSAFDAGRGFKDDPQVQKATRLEGDVTAASFDAVSLDPGADKELRLYLDAAPGDALNLSADEIEKFRALRRSGRSEVEAAIRDMLFARYTAYRSKGLAGIPGYARDKSVSEPGTTLRAATQAAKGIAKYVPEFHAALLGYPDKKPASVEEHFYCIRYAMSGRPNITLRHRMATSVGAGYVVADREYYVGHDYNETQAIAALLPVANGTVVVYTNRTTTDQLGGFGATAKQAIGRSMMSKQLRGIFEESRKKLGGAQKK